MALNERSTQPPTSSSSPSSSSSFFSLPASTSNHHRIKALPTLNTTTTNNNNSQTTDGLCVYEFFSGIGGMRVALPDHIAGVPITHIESFDISDTANKVYALNFHDQHKDKGYSDQHKGLGGDNIRGGVSIGDNNIRGGMHPTLIERLSLADVDGRAGSILPILNLTPHHLLTLISIVF